MNREIKFRAWVKLSPQGRYAMVDVTGIDWKHNRIEKEHGAYSLIGNVLMQYTNLKDKNGVEVYENDILHVYEVSNYKSHEYISHVEFIDSGFLVTEPDGCQVPLDCFHRGDSSYPLFEIEIIGNTYEHADLLPTS